MFLLDIMLPGKMGYQDRVILVSFAVRICVWRKRASGVNPTCVTRLSAYPLIIILGNGVPVQ